MRKKKLRKKLRQNSNHYSKKIVPLLPSPIAAGKKTNLPTGRQGETMKPRQTWLVQWNNILCFLFVLFLPTQFGKHFFFDFSYLSGVRVDFLAPTLYLSDILAMTLIFLNFSAVLKFILNKKILILLLLLLINVMIAKLHPISVYRYLKIIELLGVFVVFRQTRLSYRLVLSGFLAGAVFELVLALAQFINKQSLQGFFYFFGERLINLSMPGIAKASLDGREFLRPYATFSHPNSMAGFYLLVYFFALNIRSINPWVKNILLLVCGCLIFISFSKIAIITFLLFNLINLWQSPLKKSCSFCFFARTSVLAIVSFVFLQAHSDPLSLSKRLQLIEDSRTIIRQQPFFGTGLGKYLYEQHRVPQVFFDLFNQPVHNIFLLLISEVGLVIFFLLLLLFNKKSWQLFKTYPYIVLAILITGFFDHYWLTLQQNWLLLGVIMGLLL